VRVVLYYHTEPQQQFAREHVEDLAQEMRRVPRLTAEEAGYPAWRRLGAELIRHAERLRRRYHAPAFDV
jgi:hypothetical protein